ncbi:MAG TPA: lamin tail domain-containing protein, partial [Kofleriaceae bacterium]|nr:lamin tail domain-containing protein [Kofleriaceae bacterium]
GDHALAAGTLAPGELLLLHQADLGFGAAAGDVLSLQSADRATVLDAVRVVDVPRGRAAPAMDWRYPDVATPGVPNVFVVHDEVVIDEVMYHAPPVTNPDGTVTRSPLEWVELHDRTGAPVDLGGWQLVDGAAFELPAGTTLPAGGYLVVTSDLGAFTAAYPSVPAAQVLGDLSGGLSDHGERLELRDACANPVDHVRYLDDAPWPPEADGGGASLELQDESADHDAPEAWAASVSGAPAWQTITYEAVAAASPVGPDGQWQELVLGLLDAGVVLVDDVHVTVDPATAPAELVDGGDFESGGAAFRWIGDHRHSEVVVDPDDPGNHVLRLVATGPTEHMHNHVETTLTGGHRITNGRTYRISLRARWISGSNLLNTRLYFNRLARTTALAVGPVPGTPGAPNSRAVANLGPTYRDLGQAPVVPQPGEPVVVSVTAVDPDGVGDVTLRYVADGGAPASLPMTAAGGGRYTATVPGRAAGSQVQFWIEGRDVQGATSMFPAAGPASRALWKVDDGLAATNGLHNLRILMDPADAAWLFAAPNLMSNDDLPATVIVDEREAIYDAGVRLKGSERGRPTTPRIGFGLRFPADHPLRGLRTALVDRSQGVGYGQRELFFFQAMNRAGAVPSQYDDLIQVLPPRADLVGAAHLQLARFGDAMLDGQFDHGGDGDLFEYELVYYPTTTDNGLPTGAKLPQPDSVVGTAIRDLGDDEEAYRQDFIIKANRWRDDYRGFIHFAKVFGQSGAAFDAQVGDVIDVDQWLRAFAVATLSGAIDNYASGAAHNADFYLRPSDGRTLYFPHDLDFLGGPQGPVVASGDLAKLIAVPARARAYYGDLHDIIQTAFNGTYMASWSQQMGALLPGQDFAGHLQYVRDRATWVTSGAANSIMRAIPPVAFSITTGGGAAVSVTAPTVDLDGQGWIDVHDVVRMGTPMPIALTWPTTSTWHATLPVACGASTIRLDAFDPHGAAVGTASIDVTRSGPGC